jgi:hypothetical protein
MTAICDNSAGGKIMQIKKTIFILLFFMLNMSLFVFAQDENATKATQKPLKEDFFHTWVTEGGKGLSKNSTEITFNNETSYTLVTGSLFKTKQTFIISSWEEIVNTYSDTDEYPYGFKISSKEDNNRSQNFFSMFINADKTKYLSVMALGDYIQYNIYTKKK